MKKLILISITFLMMTGISFAGVELYWGQSTGIVEEYKVFVGITDVVDDMTQVISVDNETFQYPLANMGLDPNTDYFFCIKASNEWGDSLPSNIAPYTTGTPSIPGTCGVRIIIEIIP